MMVNVNVQTGLIPPQCLSVKRSGFLRNFYILVYIRNCGVLNFLELDDKWHCIRYRDITDGDLNPMALVVTNRSHKISAALIVGISQYIPFCRLKISTQYVGIRPPTLLADTLMV